MRGQEPELSLSFGVQWGTPWPHHPPVHLEARGGAEPDSLVYPLEGVVGQGLARCRWGGEGGGGGRLRGSLGVSKTAILSSALSIFPFIMVSIVRSWFTTGSVEDGGARAGAEVGARFADGGFGVGARVGGCGS